MWLLVQVIHGQKLMQLKTHFVNSDIVKELLDTLNFFEDMMPEINTAVSPNVCSENAYHTGNILSHDNCTHFKNKLKKYIKHQGKNLDLFHIHLIHFYDLGYERAHDHKKTEDYSFVLYLQDSEDGHTCFEIDNKVVKVKPEKGKLVFFPSDIWHWGEQSSGKKKIAVGALKCVD